MTAATALTVRVTVTDAWDTVRLEVPANTTIHDLKVDALRRALGKADIDAYQVKFRGALMLQEGRTLADAGVPSGAALIVLAARRRPVR